MSSGSASHKTSEGNLEMNFSTCKSCGRVGFEMLKRNGVKVLTGTKARRLFQRCTQGESMETLFREEVGSGVIEQQDIGSANEAGQFSLFG